MGQTGQRRYSLFFPIPLLVSALVVPRFGSQTGCMVEEEGGDIVAMFIHFKGVADHRRIIFLSGVFEYQSVWSVLD